MAFRTDVSLTPLSLEHAPRMLDWMADPVVRRGIGLRTEPSLDKTEDWIRRALANPTMQPFAIVLEGTHVGNVVLDRLDDYLRTARLSIYVGEAAARGAGVGRTAVSLAAAFGFEQWNLHKIWLTVHAENFSALRAYQQVGFQLEGILRDEFLLDGRRLPAVYLGLLREDFQRRSTEPLQEKAL